MPSRPNGYQECAALERAGRCVGEAKEERPPGGMKGTSNVTLLGEAQDAYFVAAVLNPTFGGHAPARARKDTHDSDVNKLVSPSGAHTRIEGSGYPGVLSVILKSRRTRYNA